MPDPALRNDVRLYKYLGQVAQQGHTQSVGDRHRVLRKPGTTVCGRQSSAGNTCAQHSWSSCRPMHTKMPAQWRPQKQASADPRTHCGSESLAPLHGSTFGVHVGYTRTPCCWLPCTVLLKNSRMLSEEGQMEDV